MTNENFTDWALDPKRTIEEAFCAELLIEIGLRQWNVAHKIFKTDVHAQIEARKRRALNPAHRHGYSREDIARAAEFLPMVAAISMGNYDDRPLRDITALRFVPQAVSLSISQSELTDLSPLLTLTRLETLGIYDKEIEDFSLIGQLTGLKSLSLSTQAPWPRLAGLENLRRLEVFTFSGNLLTLQDTPVLHATRKITLSNGNNSLTPVRDLSRLPLMPACADIEISGTCSLEGVGRWSHVRSLKLSGPFKNLGPLASAGLDRLTYLNLNGQRFTDLAPLSFLPELRLLALTTSQPLDLFALSESPQLHEIRIGPDFMTQSTLNEREAAIFNAGRENWDTEFLLTEPRALPPQELYVHKNDAPHARHLSEFFDTLPPLLEGHVEMLGAENLWFNARVSDALNRHFGHANWGKATNHFLTRVPWVEIHTLEAAERLWQIAHVIRTVLATVRIQHAVFLRIELLLRYERQTTEWQKKRDSDAFNPREAREEHEDWLARKKTQQLYLEQLHRYRLAQSEGARINPKDFAVEPAEPEPVFETEPDSDLLERPDDGDDEPDPHPLAENYDSNVLLREDGLWVPERWCPAIQLLTNRRAIPREPPPPPTNRPPPDEPPPTQPGPPDLVKA